MWTKWFLPRAGFGVTPGVVYTPQDVGQEQRTAEAEVLRVGQQGQRPQFRPRAGWSWIRLTQIIAVPGGGLQRTGPGAHV